VRGRKQIRNKIFLNVEKDYGKNSIRDGRPGVQIIPLGVRSLPEQQHHAKACKSRNDIRPDNFYENIKSHLVSHIREQGHDARALDRPRQLTLVYGANARHAFWHYLAALRNVLAQKIGVLVVDLEDLVRAERAYLLTPHTALPLLFFHKNFSLFHSCRFSA
jgi:hypothetical protein